MLFLQRQSLLCACIIWMQFYACLIVSGPEDYNVISVQSFCTATKIPFKVSVNMKPFDKNFYKKPYKMFDPEQCYTRRATLWCVQHNQSNEVFACRSQCTTIVPFGGKKIAMRPFANIRQDIREGIKHYYLQDDDYDKQYGYLFLLIGRDLFNEYLSEPYRKYLPEPYYTKRSIYWCVRDNV